jgi:hypothetical protein
MQTPQLPSVLGGIGFAVRIIRHKYMIVRNIFFNDLR